MKFRRFALSMTAVVAVVVVGGVVSLALTGCVDTKKAVEDARKELEMRDYFTAVDMLLQLSDSKLVDTDSINGILAEAYYGLTVHPLPDIARGAAGLDFSHDGKWAVIPDCDGSSISITSPTLYQSTKTIPLDSEPFDLAVSPDGKNVAVALNNHLIEIYDISTWEKVQTLTGHTARVRGVAYGDDNTLYSSSNDRTVRAWDLESGKEIMSKEPHARNVKAVNVSKDGRYVVTASNDGTSVVLNAKGPDQGKEVMKVVHGGSYVNDAKISPDGKLLITVSGDSNIKFWNVPNGTLYASIDVGEALGSLDFSPDGKTAVAGGSNYVYVIDVENRKLISRCPAGNSAIWGIKFLDNDNFVFVDSSHIYRAPVIRGQKLVEAARKYIRQNPYGSFG